MSDLVKRYSYFGESQLIILCMAQTKEFPNTCKVMGIKIKYVIIYQVLKINYDQTNTLSRNKELPKK